MRRILYLIFGLFIISISFSETLWELYQERDKIESYLDYPANSRLLFMPSAFTPGSRTLVFNNREIMNSEMVLGIANRVQVSGGFLLIPAYSGLAYLNFKYRFLDMANDNIHIATFGSALGSAGFGNYSGYEPPNNLDEIQKFWGYENSNLHYLHGLVVTFGNEYHNFNISGSMKFSKGLQQYYFISAGGALSIIKNVKFMADYTYIPRGLYRYGFGAIAMRYYTKQFSCDGGIAIFDEKAKSVPFIQFMYTPKF
ncbi:MAG: hypothetical protein ACLFSQ_00535 [Candidatus Zixiibacteriota bacterium]